MNCHFFFLIVFLLFADRRVGTSMNSPYVCCGCLSEYTIRLEYTYFLQAISFRRVGSTWGPTSGIKVEVTVRILGV